MNKIILILGTTLITRMTVHAAPATEESLAQLARDAKAAEYRKTIAESEAAEKKIEWTLIKEKAEAEAAALKAQLPTPETKPSAGGYTADPYALAHKIQASRALLRVTGVLADRLKDRQTIIITANKELASKIFVRYALRKTADDLRTKIADAGTTNAGVVAYAEMAKAIIGTAADIYGFFKTTTTQKSADVTLPDTAVVGATCQSLRKNRSSEELKNLHIVPADLGVYPLSVAEENADNLENAIAKLRETVDTFSKKPQTDELKKALADAAVFLNSVRTDTTSPTGLYAPVQNLPPYEIAINNQWNLLYIEVFGAGGSTKTTSGVFDSGTVSYSGGCCLTYYLVDQLGDVADSGIIFDHMGWDEFDDEGGIIPSLHSEQNQD